MTLSHGQQWLRGTCELVAIKILVPARGQGTVIFICAYRCLASGTFTCLPVLRHVRKGPTQTPVLFRGAYMFHILGEGRTYTQHPQTLSRSTPSPKSPPPSSTKILFSPISEKARLRTFQRLFLLFRILTLLCSVAASIRQVDLRISLVQGLKLLELKPQCRISTKG